MPLSEEEKVAIRHHTGFLNVAAAYTFVLGSPAAVETQFIIEGAMDRVLERALPRLREILAKLELTEQQMFDDQELAAVNQIGEIQVNQREQRQLRKQYTFWRDALCNMLGVTPNPFDKRFTTGGINVPVGS